MTTFRIAAAAAIAVGLLAATPALAADLGRPSLKDDQADWGPARPRYNWAGLYVGAHVGYGFGTSSQTDLGAITTGRFDTDGYVAGGQIGYNLQVGSLVYGLEADISATDISGTSFTNCAVGCTSSLDYLGTIRARLGVDMGGVMPYITGGFAYGDATAATNGLAAATDTLTGWTAGAGVEMKLSQNWSIRGEYLYVDLGHLNVPTPAPTRADFDEIHVIRGGLNFKF
ncbi:MAG: porin family protein [Hyphomicrobiaceae bacterium]